MKKEKINLEDPSSKYRPVPFWSWNDRLEPEELRRQIREMHEAGIGGFFMHARGGLQTAYLSPEWMECVRSSIDEAGKLGMNAWLYDENGWPSGFGGGLVNGLGLDYQQKYLRFEEGDAADFAQERPYTIAFYRADNLKFLGRKLTRRNSGRVIRAFFEVNEYYVDNLDAKVVAEFLRVTHQHYYENLPADLRKAMKGIFTDEPQLSRKGLLWSFVIEEEYRKTYDRDLLAELPLLQYDIKGSGAVRIRFWKLCGILFAQNFLKQIFNWCDAHGWMLTGHHVQEETCQSQTNSNGSIMAQYEYYHIPGMDHLGRRNPDAVAMTQLVSVAEETGKKQILTESFACCGWNFNLSGMRWLFQQQLAHGINLCCPHLQSYTLRGLRKRDYPASLFVHQPWWPEYRSAADFFARAGMLLAEGTPVYPKVLVIHPLSSAWRFFRGNQNVSEMEYYTQGLRNLTRELDSLQISHHYADEILFDKYGSVEGRTIRIGQSSFDLVILPPVANLSSKLAKALLEFDAAEGTVLRVRNRLEPGVFCIDGEPASEGMTQWFETLPSFDCERAAAEAAFQMLPMSLRVTENGVPTSQIGSTRRYFRSLNGRRGYFYFLANLDADRSCNALISLAATGDCVEVIPPESGEFLLLGEVEKSNGRLFFDYPFAPGDSLMLFVSKKPANEKEKVRMEDPSGFPVVKKIPTVFRLPEHFENILSLDRCRCRIDGGEWFFDDTVEVQTRLLLLERDCHVELEYDFELGSKFPLDSTLYMVVENPERFRFKLNGRSFAAHDAGMVFDTAFRRVKLPPRLRTGVNTLRLETEFHQTPETYQGIRNARKFESEANKLSFDSEIEAVYLMGEFCVTHAGREEMLPRDAVRCYGHFLLDAPAKTVDLADLVGNGFPFYAGKGRFSAKFKLTVKEVRSIYYLRFVNRRICAVRIFLNGKEAGCCCWAPYAVNVEGLLEVGENFIEIEIETSLRNMLGPFHLAKGEGYSIGPASFFRNPTAWGRRPAAWAEGYCFVLQGIEKIELV